MDAASTHRLSQMNSRRRLRNSSLYDGDDVPRKLPQIRLRHGQALWLLAELGYRGAVSESAFFEYIKSLRKLGIPFGYEKFQSRGSKRLARYSFYHFMELATVLSLRVYHVVPDAVLRGVVRYRDELYRFYRRAFEQRHSGAGRPILIKVKGCEPIELRGLFLDLNIQFAGGHLVRFGPPKLLSSIDTLAKFTEGTSSGRASIPLSLSLLSERVILLALRAPEIRSGPPKSSFSTARLRTRQSKRHLPASSLEIE
jgi:hypothetical protein